MEKYLTGEQVLSLKRSFRKIDADRVAEKFYEKLFAHYPMLRSMFPADTSDLRSKLMSVFELVIFSFEEKKHGHFGLHDSVIIPFRHLGKLHDGKGVISEHYTIANTFLIQAMEEQEPKVFTNEVKESWRLALNHLSAAMQDTTVKVPTKDKGNSHLSFRETFSNLMQRIRRTNQNWL